MALVTPEYIDNFLTKNPSKRAEFIGRALVVLFNNQTRDEKAVNDTCEHNGIGFTGADANSGSISAKFFLKHRTLQDWNVERWMKRNKKGQMRIAKYWRQLDAEAQRKRQAGSKPATQTQPAVDRGYVTRANIVQDFKTRQANKAAEENAQAMRRAHAQQALDSALRKISKGETLTPAEESAYEAHAELQAAMGPEWATRVKEKAEFAEMERQQEERAHASGDTWEDFKRSMGV